MDMKIDTIFLKRLFSISMIVILSIVTYNRLEKLLKEETGLTQKFTENGISLPSLTICVRDFNEELVRLQIIQWFHFYLINSYANFQSKEVT